MLDLKKLPEPTLLIWDCPEGLNKPYYPCLIGEHYKSQQLPQSKWRMVYTTNNKQWMENSEWLREPTVEEHIKFKSEVDQLILRYKENNALISK